MRFKEYVEKRDAELNEYIGGLAGQAIGGAAGSLLGPMGTFGGAMAGRYLGNKFDNWLKGTKQRSDAVAPEQKGWGAKTKDWLRNKYLNADAWAEKHPFISNLASAGAGLGLHHYFNSPAAHTDNSADNSDGQEINYNHGNADQELQAAQRDGERYDGNWNSKVGDHTSWLKDGQHYIKGEDGNFYKVYKNSVGGYMYQKYDSATNSWIRPSNVTDYMRNGGGNWRQVK